jgi:O-antigen ligase
VITTGIHQIIYLFILLLPFERLLTFDLFGFTVKPAYLLALVYFFWLILSILLKPALILRLKFSISNIKMEEYLLFTLVGWSFLSSFWSLSPKRTLIYSSLLLLFIIIFIALRRLVNNDIRQKALNVIIWLGLVVSILAVIQFFIEPFFGFKIALLREQYNSQLFGFPRPHATFLEPLYLANFLLFPIFLEINQKSKIKNQRYGNYVILVIMLVAFLLTLSRGAYLGLSIGFVVIVAVSALVRRFDRRYITRFLIVGAMSITISLASIYIVAGNNGINNFYNHATKTTDLTPTNEIEALQNRGLSREIAIQNFTQNPITGTGLASFGALSQFEELREVGEWQTVNNQYLEIATELGIIGLLIFVATIYLAVSCQLLDVRRGKYQNIVYLGWLVAVLVQYLTFSSVYLMYLWVFLAIIWPVDTKSST